MTGAAGALRPAVAAFVGLIWLASASAVSAESALWTLTASPLVATVGVRTDFSLIATNEDPLAAVLSSSEIGCLFLDVPSNFSVKGAVVTGSTAGDSWGVDSIVGNRVTVHVNSGGDRLQLLDSVSFTVSATATSTGSLAWAAKAYRDHDCEGSGALVGVPPVVVVSGSSATPTPTPTPATPTPTPTPLLPLPTLNPSLPVLATPTPTPAPTAAPSSDGGSTATPTPPSSTGAPGTASAPTESEASSSPDGAGEPAGRPSDGGGGSIEVGVPFEPGSVELGLGGIGVLEGVEIWIVPAATFGVSGLLILVWVGLQAVGAFAWVPAVQRLRGEDRTL